MAPMETSHPFFRIVITQQCLIVQTFSFRLTLSAARPNRQPLVHPLSLSPTVQPQASVSVLGPTLPPFGAECTPKPERAWQGRRAEAPKDRTSCREQLWRPPLTRALPDTTRFCWLWPPSGCLMRAGGRAVRGTSFPPLSIKSEESLRKGRVLKTRW